MEFDTKKCEARIGIFFKDRNYLKQAFIHRSYLNEHTRVTLWHNERFEFLGDAVLELIVTDHLYRAYPDKQEGELTSYRSGIVNTMVLARASTKLGLGDFLLLSRGEARDTGRGRTYILANTFEALVGAIYLDQGYGKAKEFVEKNLLIMLEEVVSQNLWLDPKSFFQEKAQEALGITPHYKVHSEVGPDHAKIFTIGLYLGHELVTEGQGASKQEAEQDAAKKGLIKKGWRKE